LEQLGARFDEAGFPAQLLTEDFGSLLTVTDPDGQVVQVHASPRNA
jgi:hypothetical protein